MSYKINPPSDGTLTDEESSREPESRMDGLTNRDILILNVCLEPVARLQVVALTGLPRTSTYNRINKLLKWGYLEEIGQVSGHWGRDVNMDSAITE